MLLQAVEFFINNYGLDARWLTATIIAGIVLFPAAVLWNWRHGEIGEQAFLGSELESWLAWAYFVCGAEKRYAVVHEKFEAMLAEHPQTLDPAFAYYFLTEGDTDRLIALVERFISARSPTTMFSPIFTLGGMGWNDDDLAQRQARLEPLLRSINLTGSDFNQ